MHSLLTSYSTYFNNKHSRAGHLFQNRFKSLLCSDEEYFMELIRYIHLNPIRANLIENLEQLTSYPWTGHSGILGTVERVWQEVKSVLAFFAHLQNAALGKYITFVSAGLVLNAEQEHAKFESPILECDEKLQSYDDWAKQMLLNNETYKDDLGSNYANTVLASDTDVKIDESFIFVSVRPTHLAEYQASMGFQL